MKYLIKFLSWSQTTLIWNIFSESFFIFTEIITYLNAFKTFGIIKSKLHSQIVNYNEISMSCWCSVISIWLFQKLCYHTVHLPKCWTLKFFQTIPYYKHAWYFVLLFSNESQHDTTNLRTFSTANSYIDLRKNAICSSLFTQTYRNRTWRN